MITEEEKNELYKEDQMLHGREYIMILTIEEMAELIKEICKALRDDLRKPKMAEEHADVEIMLEQLIRLNKNADCVKNWKESKLVRLKKRLERIGGEK